MKLVRLESRVAGVAIPVARFSGSAKGQGFEQHVNRWGS